MAVRRISSALLLKRIEGLHILILQLGQLPLQGRKRNPMSVILGKIWLLQPVSVCYWTQQCP